MSRDSDSDVFLKETESLHNLRALEEIEKNPHISQRELSTRLGVALGITNSLLKALVRKGLIKMRGENNRSLTYHVTHAGVLAKSALAVKWTLNTIDFYRQARQAIADQLRTISEDGIESIILFGVSELTEIALVVASSAGLVVAGVVDKEGLSEAPVLGVPVGTTELIDELHPDALVICQDIDDNMRQQLADWATQGIAAYYLPGTEPQGD